MSLVVFALFLGSTLAYGKMQPVVPPLRHFPPSSAPATGQDPNHNLAENYVIMLTMIEKDKPPVELSIMTSVPDFHVEMGEPAIVFSGVLTPIDKDEIEVRYNLSLAIEFSSNNAVQYRNQAAGAGARLRLGETLQVLKVGPRTYKLTISRAAEDTKKEK